MIVTTMHLQKISDLKEYSFTFETNLNNNMRLKIHSRSFASAKRKLKRMYPSAFNIFPTY